MHSREQEAGVLYEQGAQAVRAGGSELHLLASHLALMIKGTVNHAGPLWPVRVLHDGREIRLDRFIDYLRKPEREGLGIPSLHFLRQVLKASPNHGEEALNLVKKELAKEHVDLDETADRERDAAMMKHQLKATGRPPATEKGGPGPPLDTSARRAARLADRRPDLAEQVRAGSKKLSVALVEAGIRKKPAPPLTQIRKLWAKLDRDERYEHLKWTLAQCATCGRNGAENGMWCDACCDEGYQK
jgi:hypothetical protein